MSLLRYLRTYTRHQRKLKFLKFIQGVTDQRPLRVLDIGGTVAFWRDWWRLTEPDGIYVTLANNHLQDDTHDSVSDLPFLINWRVDATQLTRDDFARFDCLFSNSCIEHLTSRDEQRQLAQSILDSKLPYFVQVPNKYALIDPHYPRPYVPMFGAYPRHMQRRILMALSLGQRDRHTFESATQVLHHYHPLGPSDMRSLFPTARVAVERPLGIPMSILAMRLSDAAAPAPSC
jgi:hypothetical protein